MEFSGAILKQKTGFENSEGLDEVAESLRLAETLRELRG
jgi:hypothetical protein